MLQLHAKTWGNPGKVTVKITRKPNRKMLFNAGGYLFAIGVVALAGLNT